MSPPSYGSLMMASQSLLNAINEGAARFRELPEWQQEALLREADSTRVKDEDLPPSYRSTASRPASDAG